MAEQPGSLQPKPASNVNQASTPQQVPQPPSEKKQNWIKWAIIAVVAFALLDAGRTFFLELNKNQPSTQPQQQVQQPSPSTTTAVDTSTWKTRTSPWVAINGSFGFSYPSDWIFQEPGVDCPNLPQVRNCPNWGILFSHDKTSCIGIQVSTAYQNEGKDRPIDEQINIYFTGDERGADKLGTGTLNVLDQKDIELNGNLGKIETVNLADKKFMTAAVILGEDTQYPTTNQTAILTTCSTNEDTIFPNVVKSITIRNDQGYLPSEIHDFPLYPKNYFIEKEKNSSDTSYMWGISDNFDLVSNWYIEDKSGSGWKCTGRKDFNGNNSLVTQCNKGNLQYELNLSYQPSKNSPSGKYLQLILKVPSQAHNE